ncbi:MAG: type III pantothenate kinase [Flavobacteriaceae bacterium]
MYLLGDFGNTKIKLALYDSQSCVDQQAFEGQDPWEAKVQEWREEYSIEKGIFANVSGRTDTEILAQMSIPNLRPLKAFSKLPFNIQYQTPNTLGDDRLALVAAARKNYAQRNVLIVDLGSCITYDFCSDVGDYWGGAISPGFDLRYRALHSFTGRLPQLQPEIPESFMGQTTQGAIHAGVYHGVWGEILHQYTQYAQRHPNLMLILTGGNASLLPKTLKNTIFAQPNFLFEGLHFILQLNETS